MTDQIDITTNEDAAQGIERTPHASSHKGKMWGRIKVYTRDGFDSLKVRVVTHLQDGSETIDLCSLDEIARALILVKSGQNEVLWPEGENCVLVPIDNDSLSTPKVGESKLSDSHKTA